MDGKQEAASLGALEAAISLCRRAVLEGAHGQAAAFERLISEHPELVEPVRFVQRGYEFGLAACGSTGLASRQDPNRYTEEEVSQTGMGLVMVARDRDLDRTVAMKVLADTAGPDRPRGETVERFLREARLTARLEHPGVAPVHEVGIDAQGRAYFTMRRIRGQGFDEIAPLVLASENGWNLPRALDILLKSCQAVAYAHSQGIAHGTLHLGRVLVGDLGEVYVTSWGEAAPANDGDADAHSAKRDEAMAADTRALGKMLEQLLGLTRYHNPSTPPELVSVCEKSSGLTKEGPYATCAAFAEDLQAFLDRRVVKAYERGSIAELRKWLLRNKAFALTTGVAIAFALVSWIAAVLIRRHSLHALEEKASEIASANRAAEENASTARLKLNEVLRLSDVRLLARLEEQAKVLWPAVTEKVKSLELWLEDAEALSNRIESHRRTLSTLRERALPYGNPDRDQDRSTHPDFAKLKYRLEEKKQLEDERKKVQAALHPGDHATILSFGPDPQRKPLATFLRHEFTSSEGRELCAAVLRLAADDGALVTLNGVEIARLRLPEGRLGRDTLTTESISGSASIEEVKLPTLSLRGGRNVLAAEVRQAGLASSDLYFDLEIRSGEEILVAPGSSWRYLDGGAEPPESWAELAFDDSGWPSGPAPLGYGFRSGAGRLLEIPSELNLLEAEIAALESRVSERRTWRFTDEGEAWWHQTLSNLVSGLERFTSADRQTGALTSVQGRLVEARNIFSQSISKYESEWREAIRSISDPDECPVYRGLKIVPQVGLVPLGRDPQSGLWEFAYLPSGTAPRRDAEGRLLLTEDMGVVLVLLPGGTFRMGAVRPSPERPLGSSNVDPTAQGIAGPVHEVTLDPFFMSKYELTQGQWVRWTGENPSHYPPPKVYGGKQNSLLSPVENVSWPQCNEVLTQMGLQFPTEAQWEYGARAGTSTVWWTGDDKESLRGAGNIRDSFCRQHGGEGYPSYEEWLDDGWTIPAPAGTYRANSFGLHDVIGNVDEWCLDQFSSYETLPLPGSGERTKPTHSSRLCRGGGWDSDVSACKLANRFSLAAKLRSYSLGVRPARNLSK